MQFIHGAVNLIGAAANDDIHYAAGILPAIGTGVGADVYLPLGSHDVADYRGAKARFTNRQPKGAERQLREIEFAVLIAGKRPLLAGGGV